MKLIKKNQRSYYMGPGVEPALQVASGDAVTFETVDCFSEMVTSEADVFTSFESSLETLPGWNPVTGPVYVEGAQPGDCLSIEILDIQLPVQGTICHVPGFGMTDGHPEDCEDLVPETRLCPIRDGKVYLPTNKGEIAIPAAPMIGTISVAPAQETIASFKFGAEQCGNVDCKEITMGNTLILPVNTEGALFGLGDVHAVQGDGEITGVAVEVSARVTVRINLIPKDESPYQACPQVNGRDFIGSIGCHFGKTIEANITYAYQDLVKRLHKDYGFKTMDAYHLLSQAGEVRVCQVLGNLQAALAKVKRCYIE